MLKEGKDIPPDLQEKIQKGKEQELEKAEKVDGVQTELTTLRDKVRHREIIEKQNTTLRDKVRHIEMNEIHVNLPLL